MSYSNYLDFFDWMFGSFLSTLLSNPGIHASGISAHFSKLFEANIRKVVKILVLAEWSQQAFLRSIK